MCVTLSLFHCESDINIKIQTTRTSFCASACVYLKLELSVRQHEDEGPVARVASQLSENPPGAGVVRHLDPEVLKKLQVQLQQRDNEIGILVGMLKRRDGEFMLDPQAASEQTAIAQGARSGEAASAQNTVENGGIVTEAHQELTARTKAFEMFRKSYRKNEATEEKKAELRQRYTEAKSLGEAVNASRARIQGMKTLMEKRRILRAVDGDTSTNAPMNTEEDARLTEDILLEKVAYRSSFERLKVLKNEILGIQKILEQSRMSLQADFERWYGATMHRNHPTSRPHTLSSPQSSALIYSSGLTHGNGRAPTEGTKSSTHALSTGNKEADEDIAAFYKARDEILQRTTLVPR